MKSKNPPNELVAAVKTHQWAFWGVAAFSGAINLLYLSPAIYMLQIYDRVLTSRSETTLGVITGLVLGLYVTMAALENFRSAVLIRVGNALDGVLSKRVFTAAFERNLRAGPGTASQAMNDLNQLRQFFTGNGLFAFMDAPWLPIYLIVIFLFHPLMGWFAVIGASLLITLAILSDRLSKKPLAEASSISVTSNQYVNSNLRNAEVIEAMGMLPDLLKRWYAMQSRMLRLQSLASDRAAVMVASTKFMRLTLQSGMLALGAYIVLEGQATPGIMIAATILLGRALAPVEMLIGTWKGFVGAKTSYERLTELLSYYPARVNGMRLPYPKGIVSAENVYIAPPSTKTAILKNLSFTFGPGEIVGIVGPSASGKSTLARAIVGVWQTQIGTIRLDGADIFQWDKQAVGPAIGYLPQDVELFEGTIAENICRFGEANAHEIIAAATACGVHEMILRFPSGYDTHIGEAGNSLSGGQRQRIALARAIYGAPSLIVLDEPNSNLDDQGEVALMRAILKMKEGGKTIVLITHRTSTLKIVDKLMILADGGIAAYGPRDTIIKTLSTRPPQSRDGPEVTPADAGGKLGLTETQTLRTPGNHK